ncbi:hypothetical protein [Streptomyces sp. UNOB3_S3]|uniref:hypothetical protein n=1 Tax=Streptomyces sp. UNOB3_S3 TaxID=2871682 RepID=UPI001E40BA84|nr:hypothetical protein [Streptomyces sp. UNOB3_S3]MCC3774288.1 hypothetical protein [Streptomyces sp. UNOB3_S3]
MSTPHEHQNAAGATALPGPTGVAPAEPSPDVLPAPDPGLGPDPADDGTEADDTAAEHAWDSRRDLYRHSPGIMLGRSAQLGGSLVGGDQHGVSGGQVTGDVILGGSKIEYHLGGDAEERSGEIPAAEVAALALRFVFPERAEGAAPGREERHPAVDAPAESTAADESAEARAWEPGSPFDLALTRLKEHRVAVISGPATTGRSAAALMLLRAVGSTSYRALDPALSPGRLAGELRDGCGHLVADFPTTAERPLREHHLRALSEKLQASGSHLVIVVGPHPVVHGSVGHVAWQPPEPAALLRGHLRHKDLAGHGVDDLLALTEVRSALGHRRPVAELARFADRIAAYAQGTLSLADLAAFGHYAAERQVRAWFDSTEQTLHDKAFLIALATFDEAPYPLTAELSDVLFGFLQRIENPGEPARIPVFGTSSAQRVEHAQADRYQEAEETEWGPVLQTKVQFRDPLTAITLLREVWTGHPSARPALVAWLRRLALDPRPVVRTRAASTAAVLAQTDLPSTMALLVRPWALQPKLRARLAAASALALAHHLGAPHVPRVLREWCADSDHRPRWTAVRTYALVGDAFPAEALDALMEAVRGVEARGGPAPGWPDELDEIAQSAATLLLAAGQNGGGGREAGGAAAELWPALVPLMRGGATREFVLRTVVHACGPTDTSGDAGRPLLLDLFGRADATAGTPGGLLRQSLAALWRGVLNDPLCSTSGLETMRRWVRAAEADPEAEQALSELLPLLAVSVEDTKRLAYLLDNLRGEPGSTPLAAAVRLRAVLSLSPTPTAPAPQ